MLGNHTGRWSLLCAGLAVGVAVARQPARAQARSEFVATFSTNARVQQQWQQLEKLAKEQSWDAWITLYQRLVDDDRDLVLIRDAEFLDGIRYL
ncbi:MAG: hypothetical protein FJX77_15175, partial [Armatimonadetes bacterium]|nr:hypothetical protein [Armatimonadota bacterium]